MAKKNFLESNPLFTDTAAAEEPTTETRGKGRPRKNDLVRDNSAQEGLTEDYTRATFILRVDQLNELKDYAYTHRITIKEALETVIAKYMEDYKANGGELLQHKK